MGRHMLSLAGLALVGLAALALILSGMIGIADPKLRLALALGLLSLSGLGLGLGLQRDANLGLRQLLIWTGSVVVFGILISYHADLRNAAVAISGQPITDGARGPVQSEAPGRVSLRAEQGGHFFAEALVDGTNVNFLIDTGATDVALAPEDAVRLGINLAALVYNIPIMTANGPTFAATVMLKEVVIGSIRMERVTATIPRGELTHSLLGMSFLRRLASFSVDSDRLVMNQ